MQNNIPLLDIYPNYELIQARWGWKERILFQAIPFIPRNTFIPFVFEIYLAWIRLTSRNAYSKYKDAKDLLVNLGCGAKGKQGWINVDAFKAPNVNCVFDCRKSLPFPDNSVKGIFCEHFFEHIDYTEEVPYFLSECYRVLQPGGVIRLIVPDATKYLEGYFQDGWELLSKIRPLDSEHRDLSLHGKYHTKMEVVNVMFRNGFQHKFAYDYVTLEFLLKKYGFSSIQPQGFGKSLIEELCIDQAERAPESLYIEAVKVVA
jgi:predicted SAM-dependent methyltransferase